MKVFHKIRLLKFSVLLNFGYTLKFPKPIFLYLNSWVVGRLLFTVLTVLINFNKKKM